MVACTLQQAFDGILERRLRRHLPVQGVAVNVIVLLVLRTPAER